MDDQTRQAIERIRDQAEDIALIAGKLLSAPPPLYGRLVEPGADLQDILANTPPELPLIFQAGDYGPLVLPPHSGEHARVLMFDTPFPVGRPPREAPPMPHFRSEGAESGLTIFGSRYTLLGLRVSAARGDRAIVTIGSDAATRAEDLPTDIILQQLHACGDPSTGQKRGIGLNARAVDVLDCQIADIKWDGDDAQAIGGWNGVGPYRIEGCYLEASGENIMFGGARMRIPMGVPMEIGIRRNHFCKPLSWRPQAWDVKNLLEFKHAAKVTVQENLFDGCWLKNQDGFALLFKPENQNGTTPWAACEDLLIERNVIVNVSSGFNLTGTDPEGRQSQRMRNVVIRHNHLVTNHTALGGSGRFLQVGRGPDALTVEYNTAMVGGAAPIHLEGGGPTPQMFRFVLRGNVFPRNKYGVKGADTGSGIQAIEKWAPGGLMEENVIGGGERALYPGNWTPTVAEFQDGFVDYAKGDYRLKPMAAWARAGADFGQLPAWLFTGWQTAP